ncbi:winged helix-turn-helix transcriptional regulator [Anaerorhabdus sp.]|uniref:winged helix-turn-helix transcriptional regulator n=1 Tax=Anaerorhabdus sp. TaxID=1872524 RepID=UPI002FC885C8
MSKVKTEYPNSFLLASDLMGGKWASIILWQIYQKNNRFSLLLRAIPEITRKMLITQLRELEQNKLIHKIVFNEIPLHTEYVLEDSALEMIPIIEQLQVFAKNYADKHEVIIK